jgi:hypothetical protein
MIMEVQIKEMTRAGYEKPVYLFECPLCDTPKLEDLDRVYVRDEVWRHLVVEHRSLSSKLDIVFVSTEVLEGMEQNRG